MVMECIVRFRVRVRVRRLRLGLGLGMIFLTWTIQGSNWVAVFVTSRRYHQTN